MGDMNLMFIVKPHFCVPPNTITSIFKGFPARVTKIYSEKYLRAEIKYLTDIFCENGHDRKALQKIINNFEKKTRSTNSNNNNNNNNNSNNNNIIIIIVIIIIIIIITTQTKSKQLPFLGYQKSAKSQTRNTKVWI